MKPIQLTPEELEAEALRPDDFSDEVAPSVNMLSVLPQDLYLVKTITIPIMMNKNRVCTINNWATTHWATKSKLKNKYKELLKDFFISGSHSLKEDCFLVWYPMYKDARKHDSINLATVSKIVEDVFTEVKAWEDDDNTSHILLNGEIDKSLTEHLVRLQIFQKN